MYSAKHCVLYDIHLNKELILSLTNFIFLFFHLLILWFAVGIVVVLLNYSHKSTILNDFRRQKPEVILLL